MTEISPRERRLEEALQEICRRAEFMLGRNPGDLYYGGRCDAFREVQGIATDALQEPIVTAQEAPPEAIKGDDAGEPEKPLSGFQMGVKG